MFKCRAILLLYYFAVSSNFHVKSVSAGYTSEETNEKSKSLYNSVTTILGTTDTSRHHHKHIYDGPPPQAPCSNAARKCPNIVATSAGEVYPCDQPSGCPLSKTNTDDGRIVGPSPGSAVGPSPNGYNGITYDTRPSVASADFVTATGYPQNGYIAGPYVGVQGPPPTPPQSPSQSGYGFGVGYSAPYGSYGPPAATTGAYGYRHPPPPPYPTYGHPAYYGYQGERGYSVMDHSLKTNSEYTEVGTHNGPLQQANNGFGYGSGYGGYMGMYNTPGF